MTTILSESERTRGDEVKNQPQAAAMQVGVDSFAAQGVEEERAEDGGRRAEGENARREVGGSESVRNLLSQGRAEMVVGRGSFIESFPLFGLELEDYDSLFAEKLDLLLKLREEEFVHWSGKHRPALTGQGVYPRPMQNPLPVWLGVGGTPESFARAGTLGLPLMVAIIGGETRRFRPLVDLYREFGKRAGHAPEKLKVGVHALGYVAETTQKAADEFFPGYAKTFTKIGRERGWPPVTRAQFEAVRGTHGAAMVGGPEEVAEKILRHSEALGGISRLTFQMDVAELSQKQLLRSIELIGEKVAPVLRGK